MSDLADVLPPVGAKGGLKASGGLEGVRLAKHLNEHRLKATLKMEKQQMAAVLRQSEFVSSPFQALNQHLLNTLPPPPLEPILEKKGNTKAKNKGKGKKKSSPSGSSAMDTN
eukprot:TRINITY_DN4012_c0_g1_i1.p3 TRINITY_DN4012_c0_g1~~TRINITY_DN4012_c0_g1_i1.p3  ORF type:complete len:112 (-),score=41.43 TRINITY_DN4012_c0_g1_i1:123-458(-)